MSEYDIIEENTKKIIDSTGNLDDIGKEAIDHNDNLEMTTKHEGGGRGQKA